MLFFLHDGQQQRRCRDERSCGDCCSLVSVTNTFPKYLSAILRTMSAHKPAIHILVHFAPGSSLLVGAHVRLRFAVVVDKSVILHPSAVSGSHLTLPYVAPATNPRRVSSSFTVGVTVTVNVSFLSPLVHVMTVSRLTPNIVSSPKQRGEERVTMTTSPQPRGGNVGVFPHVLWDLYDIRYLAGTHLPLFQGSSYVSIVYAFLPIIRVVEILTRHICRTYTVSL